MADEGKQEVDPTAILYWTIAVIISLIFILMGDFNELGKDIGYTPGVIGKIILFPFLTVGGFCGLKVGRWIRDALMPDAIFTSGISGIVKAKLFWAFVPQIIGLFGGMCAGMTLFIIPMSWLFG